LYLSQLEEGRKGTRLSKSKELATTVLGEPAGELTEVRTNAIVIPTLDHYWTTRVSGLLFTSVPEVPETVTVYVPAGVPAGGGGVVVPPPPHAI
jgi:hypothetical protein